MRAEKLYDAITQVDDDLVEQAAQPCVGLRKKRNWIPTVAAAAACAVLLAVFPRMMTGHDMAGPESPGAVPSTPSTPSAPMPSTPAEGPATPLTPGNAAFMHYAGPVFSLDVSDSAGLTAQRTVTFDLSDKKMAVTDEYVLTNTSDTDLTRVVYYPFISDFRELSADLPALTVDGVEAETTMYQGAYSGGFRDAGDGSTQERYNLKEAKNWTEYQGLLSDGSYQAYALGEGADLDIPVVVYRFGEGRTTASYSVGNHNGQQAMDVFSYGFNAYSWNEKTGMAVYEHSDRNKRPWMLIIPNGEPDGVRLEGFKDDGSDTWGVTREESTLDALLLEMAEAELALIADWDYAQEITPAMLYRAAGDILTQYGQLSEEPAERYQSVRLDDLFTDALGQNRVFYLATEIAVPAGGTVTVTADFAKAASADFPGLGSENEDVLGYDLVTTVGSRLTFTGQTARLVGGEGVEIVRQNFDFDPAAGVVQVPLNEEHYYLEIRK